MNILGNNLVAIHFLQLKDKYSECVTFIGKRCVCLCAWRWKVCIRESLQNKIDKKKLILPLIIHLCQLEGSNQKQTIGNMKIQSYFYNLIFPRL